MSSRYSSIRCPSMSDFGLKTFSVQRERPEVCRLMLVGHGCSRRFLTCSARRARLVWHRFCVLARHADGSDVNAANERMINRQLRRRGITDARVLQAFRSVPREYFVPDEQARMAYADSALPIGEGQTISQP